MEVHCAVCTPLVATVESTDIENSAQFGQDVNRDIVVSVLRAFELLEEINGSQKNFNVLKFGKVYYKDDQSLLNQADIYNI